MDLATHSDNSEAYITSMKANDPDFDAISLYGVQTKTEYLKSYKFESDQGEPKMMEYKRNPTLE